MQSMSINDLVIPNPGYEKKVDQIIKNFKKTINREIPRRQEGNLRKLASLFLNKVKVDKPIVVNLDIGQGKSTLLLEFIKYIYEVDSSFSSVIVKRTLQEGREFCIDAGVKNIETVRERLNVCNDPAKELEDMYYGNGEYKNPQEDAFIARLLRGFNYNDCLEYKDPNQAKFATGGDKLPSFYTEYSPVLCTNCPRICGAKLSKWTVDKHPAIVITHQRLFLSNDLDSIVENISGRKVLLIDEKIDTKDMGDVLLEQWEAILTKVNKSNLSDKIKDEAEKIGYYLNNLNYPRNTDDIVKIPPYSSTFKFDSAIYSILINNNFNNYQTLIAIEKFLNYGGTISRNWRNKDKKQFTYIRYINLENYTKHFEKTIILDATSAVNGEILDEDYKKSNVVFLDGLEETARKKINLYYSPQKTTKSALINKKNNKINRDYKGDMEFYLNNVNLIFKEVQDIITSTKEKTLVICYKSIRNQYGNEFKFEADLSKKLDNSEVNPDYYTVRHFGAATTGVNDFREYKNIVFIGMLNKGNLYYANKTLAIGEVNPKITELNEQVIDCIQQIGRICVRQGQEANVYMLFEDKLFEDKLFEDKLGLTQELRKHFRVKKKEWHPKYFNGINNATEAKQLGCWFGIIAELKKLEPGVSLTLNDLRETLSIFEKDTVSKKIKDPHVEEFMNRNGITYDKKEKRFYRKNTTVAQQKSSYYTVIKELEKMNEGDVVSLKELQGRLRASSKANTMYNDMDNTEVIFFMNRHSILYNRDTKVFIKEIINVQKDSLKEANSRSFGEIYQNIKACFG